MINNQLYHGDCLEVMKNISDGSIDLVLTDPPYGTTVNKWDSIINFEDLWVELKRVLKPKGVVVMFGTEPFSTLLRMSNLKNYRYDWIWQKSNMSGFLNVRWVPIKAHENISVFYNKTGAYNHGAKELEKPIIRKERGSDCYNRVDANEQKLTGYPKSILKFKSERGLHPTQKPVALMEYLIERYTNENETVLDFAMGSGTTGVACKNLNRNFMGIEKDDKYFRIAKDRIENTPEPQQEKPNITKTETKTEVTSSIMEKFMKKSKESSE